jgi:hypothetical protein
MNIWFSLPGYGTPEPGFFWLNFVYLRKQSRCECGECRLGGAPV